MARIKIYGATDGSYEGRIDNISKNGLGIRLDEPLACDDLVRVDLNEYVLIGEIRHCEPTGGAYSIAIELFEFLTRAELKTLFEQVLTSAA